jgi:hypothetical protein
VATRIVFVGAGSKNEKLSIVVDEEIGTVGQRLRGAHAYEQFQRDGQQVWVNPATVAYVEDVGEGGPMVAAF